MGKISAPVNTVFVHSPEDFGKVLLQKGILILVEVNSGRHMILAKNGTSHTVINPIFTGTDGKINSIGSLIVEAGLAKKEELEIESVADQNVENGEPSILDGVI